jgi:hypothetical protein
MFKNTSFSSQLTNGPNKLECYVALGCEVTTELFDPLLFICRIRKLPRKWGVAKTTFGTLDRRGIS